MTVHHLVTEENMTEQCIYCANSINGDWKSEFDVERHYKTIVCECGYKTHVRVNFYGSGHDDWNKNGNKMNTIDDKLEKFT